MTFHGFLGQHGAKLFGVSSVEAVRVFYAFCIKLIFQMSLIAGATLLLALYVEMYSVQQLPLLFLSQSLLVILGTGVLSGLLRQFPPSTMIMAGGFVAASLFIASFFLVSFPFLFLAALMVAISIFLAQISIWISLFIENLFSPLESERVFPVIESSEPIGGILAGFFIVGTIGTLSAVDMLLVVGGILAFLPILLFVSLQRLESMPVLCVRRKERNQSRATRSMVKNTFRFFKGNSFISILFVVIFLQYFVVDFLEFQFAHAVDTHLHASGHMTYGPMEEDSHNYANALTHSFGTIQIGIYSILLFVQLLAARQIIQKIGVIRTFALGPLLSFLSFSAMFFSFGYMTSVIARGTFEISTGVGRNAFYSSFYVLHENIRNEAKEVLEGVAKPLGLFFGTLFLLVLEIAFPADKITAIISLVLVSVAAISLFFSLRLQYHYTHMGRKKLKSRTDLPEKIDAIEILSQPGHIGGVRALIATLEEKDELPEIQIKILSVMGRIQQEKTIPAILRCFSSPYPQVQLAAVEALGCFYSLGKSFFSQSFSVYSVQEELKTLFVKSRDTDIKKGVIKIFANLRNVEIIPFLIDALHSKNPEIRSESALVCGMFHDEGTIPYIKPLLEDEDPHVRSAAIVSLWQFEELHSLLTQKMTALLDSEKEEEILAGIHAAGDVRADQEKEGLMALMRNKKYRIRRHAALALAKMNEKSATDPLLESLFHEEKCIGVKTHKMMKGVHRKISNDVQKKTMREALKRVSGILANAKTSVLENLKKEDLHELLHLFHLINAEREIWKIRMILRERGEQEPQYA